MARTRWIGSLLRITAGVATGLALLYWWQPWEVDLFPKAPPDPNPRVDPDSKKLFSAGSRVLVVTAHPDDESFYNAGALHQLGLAGAEITLLVATDGDKAYYGPFEDSARNRVVRKRETRTVLERFRGKEVIFLEHPDGRLRNSAQLRDQVRQVVERVRPEYVLAADELYQPRFSHQDHRRSGEATLAALREMGWHGWVLRYQTSAPNYWRDISKDWEAKRALLAVHASQFYGAKLGQIEGMVFQAAVDAGERGGYELAEAFRAEKL